MGGRKACGGRILTSGKGLQHQRGGQKLVERSRDHNAVRRQPAARTHQGRAMAGTRSSVGEIWLEMGVEGSPTKLALNCGVEWAVRRPA